MSLQGKNALVTGGSRGIGRAICLELARQGANVAVNYAGNAKAAEETVEACKALGVQAVAIQADVADAAACEAMVKEVISAFGSLQILVNNAGITRDNLALSISEADFDAVLDTNLKGAFHCCKAAYRPMQRRPGQLLRQQGGPHRPDQVPGQGAGRPEGHRQRGGPRLHRHGNDRRSARAGQGGHAQDHPHGPAGPAGGRGPGGGLLCLGRGRLYHRPGAVCGRRHGGLSRRKD